MCVAKTKALISFAVTEKLICTFVFAYANCWFSHARALIYLFILRFIVHVNNFSVMLGRGHHFLGFNQYSRELMCLAEGHNTMPDAPSGYRTQDLDLESDALTLCHHAPLYPFVINNLAHYDYLVEPTFIF